MWYHTFQIHLIGWGGGGVLLLFDEFLAIPQETIDAVHSCTGRIIAVGTTSVRTLETFAIGKRKINPEATAGCVSKMFIWPGGHNQFQIADGMFTNFRILQIIAFNLMSLTVRIYA